MKCKNWIARLSIMALCSTMALPTVGITSYASSEPNPSVKGQLDVGDSGTYREVERYISLATDVDTATRTIRWTVVFNKPREYWASQIPHVFFPSGIETSSINIQRKYGDGRTWTLQSEVKNGASDGSRNRFDQDIESGAGLEDWNDRFFVKLQRDPATQSDIDTIKKWKDSGKFGAHFYSQEGGGSNIFVWSITATYKEGENPWNLPIVVGEHRLNGGYPYFIVQGPFNTDKHNLTDIMEDRYGLDISKEDKLIDYIDIGSFFANEENKVAIKDKGNISTTEMKSIKAKMKNAIKSEMEKNGRFTLDNINRVLKESNIEIEANGNVTITYPDNSIENSVESKSTLTIDEYSKGRTQSFEPKVDYISEGATKISGEGEPGSTIKVVIPSVDGDKEIATTVGDSGDNTGKWSVDLTQGGAAESNLKNGDTVKVTQTENGLSESNTVEKVVGKKLSDEIEPKTPVNKIEVNNSSNLTDEEKKKVEDNVKNSNEDILDKLDENEPIKVGDDGSVTIKYKDGSEDVIAGSELVKEREYSLQPSVDPISPKSTSISGAGAPNSKIKVTLPDGSSKETTVNGEGKWNIPFDGGKTYNKGEEFTVVQTEEGKTPSQELKVSVGDDISDVVDPSNPKEPVQVENKDSLTPEEKKSVEESIKTANENNFPENTKIEFTDDGKIKIIYPDKSEDTIENLDGVIKEREDSKKPTINDINTSSKSISGTGVSGSDINVKIPGIEKHLQTKVDKDGNWSVDIPSGILPKDKLKENDKIVVEQTEYVGNTGRKRNPSTEEKVVVLSFEDKITPVLPDSKIIVSDDKNLTDKEKEKVKNTIEELNKDKFPREPQPGTKVEVGKNGDVTITYPDGSVDKISGKDLVKEPHIYVGGSSSGGSSTGTNDSEDSFVPSDRVAGEYRVDTSVKLSQKSFSSAENVVLVGTSKNIDALSASSLASKLNAPILYSGLNKVSDGVLKEIKRLGAKNITIIGGNQSISDRVFNDLKTSGYDVNRVAGEDRYQTSAEIANSVLDGAKDMQALVASGQNYYDALSISSYSAKERIPVLLVKKDSVPNSIKNIFEKNISKATIIGGVESVSDNTLGSIEKIKSNNENVSVIGRVSGENRYETSKKVADKYFANSTYAYLASGQNPADALVLGPVAGKNNSPILLTKKNGLPNEIKSLTSKYRFIVVGGTNTIDFVK